ncbi:MAG TPA: flagellar hook-basal body complex protein FliE [Jatrophihabitans sp.]|nr:flagellar hook-basal body complex protein FliE [Jatrophihabitans sp.]
MTIPAIGAVSGALPSLPTLPSAGTPGIVPSSAGGDFGSLLAKGIGQVESAQNTADSLAVKAATGDLTDIHSYTIAATQASLMTELATAIRTKGIDAFNQIMGMQA